MDRDFKGKRLGGLKIHDQLEFRRSLHRQIGRLFAPYDAINIISRLPINLWDVQTVRQQATLRGKGPKRIDSRQTVTFGKGDDKPTVNDGEAVWKDDDAATRLMRACGDGGLNAI